MNICIVSPGYPDKSNSSFFVFVKQLVDAIATHGHQCQVIAPHSITHNHSIKQQVEEYACGDGKVTVYRPNYLSLSSFRIGTFYPTLLLQKLAVARGLRQLRKKPDVIYCHFWSEGYYAYSFSKKNNIPLFVASGESEIELDFIPKSKIAAFCDYVNGVICVSSKNQDESIKLGLTIADKCGVFPNAINANLFNKREKADCRKKLGLPQDDFVAAFVGWFNDRKGPMRVAQALDKVDGVKSIFIGKGEQDPQCDGILYKGAVPHDEVPVYLNAADVFVLPTQHEGCCNAVIEAMACGLPIISSNRPFNWDVLDDSNSILIEPDDVDDIANAIRVLREDTKKRNNLAEGALRKAEGLTIEKRAKSIIDFMKSKI